MKKALLYLSIAIFLGVLGLSWLTHGTGVVSNDIARNIYIPKELTMPLQVKAAYNGRDMFFRYRWPARQPSIYHDMLKFEGGKWVRYGASVGRAAAARHLRRPRHHVGGRRQRAGVREIRRLRRRRRPHALLHQRGQAGGGEGAPLSRSEAEADRGRQVPAGNAQRHQRLGVGGAGGSAGGPAQGRVFPRPVALAGAPVESRSTSRTTSTCSSCAAATPGKGLSPTTGILRSDSRASCSTRKRPVAVR